MPQDGLESVATSSEEVHSSGLYRADGLNIAIDFLSDRKLRPSPGPEVAGHETRQPSLISRSLRHGVGPVKPLMTRLPTVSLDYLNHVCIFISHA